MGNNCKHSHTKTGVGIDSSRQSNVSKSKKVESVASAEVAERNYTDEDIRDDEPGKEEGAIQEAPEKQVLSSKKSSCFFYRIGNCDNDQCEFLHDDPDTSLKECRGAGRFCIFVTKIQRKVAITRLLTPRSANSI